MGSQTWEGKRKKNKWQCRQNNINYSIWTTNVNRLKKNTTLGTYETLIKDITFLSLSFPEERRKIVGMKTY